MMVLGGPTMASRTMGRQVLIQEAGHLDSHNGGWDDAWRVAGL